MTLFAVALAASFNLVCTGMEMYGMLEGGDLTQEHRRDFTSVYRVDLETRRWCADECTATSDIAKVTGTQLTLEEVDHAPFKRHTGINRETGAFARRD